jgi:hypothetical protein
VTATHPHYPPHSLRSSRATTQKNTITAHAPLVILHTAETFARASASSNMNEVDASTLRAERDASPERWRQYDPNDTIRARWYAQHPNAHHTDDVPWQEHTAHLGQEEAEDTPAVQRQGSHASTSSSSTNSSRSSVARRVPTTQSVRTVSTRQAEHDISRMNRQTHRRTSPATFTNRWYHAQQTLEGATSIWRRKRLPASLTGERRIRCGIQRSR